MTRLIACLALAATFVACTTDVRETIPSRFQIVERVKDKTLFGDTAYVRDTKHDLCFLVAHAGTTYETMASVPCEALRNHPAAANSR